MEEGNRSLDDEHHDKEPLQGLEDQYEGATKLHNSKSFNLYDADDTLSETMLQSFNNGPLNLERLNSQCHTHQNSE